MAIEVPGDLLAVKGKSEDNPRPNPSEFPSGPWLFATIEVGREFEGVPLGVLRGVEDALSTLALLEPDRGVMLELRKFLTGVLILSVAFAVVEDPLPGVLCSFPILGEIVDVGDAASLGVICAPGLLRVGALGVTTVFPAVGGFLESNGILVRIVPVKLRELFDCSAT